MKIIRGLQHLPTFTNPVITIGTFDGVHFGHRRIIERLNKRAKEVHGVSIILTFEPHPRLVLEGQHVKLSLLSTLDEKLALLQTLPIDYVVVVPFDKSFSEISAEAYIKNFIVDHFHPHTIIIGHDHHFGKNRTGNFNLLNALKESYHYNLEEIPVQEIEHIAVSSTKIREAIKAGNMEKAIEFLKGFYSIEGVVVKGNQRGRTIGFPTANIDIENVHKLIPAKGVYAVRVLFKGDTYGAMMNIGVKPSVSDENITTLEVHLFNFDEEIYNETLKVSFISRIRDEKKFESIEALKHQLQLDKLTCLQLLTDV